MNNQRNLTVYRLYAPVYDALFRPVFQTARKRAIDKLRLQPGERLLLSGAGTGLDLPLIPPGVQVTAVDLSHPMLQKAGEKGTGRTAFALMDAQKLGLAAA
ncbi:MAG: class I SAM-dependent methyltransferase, partial [Anaerolineae bacterium]